MCGHTYVILYFDPRVLSSTPSHTYTKQNLSVWQSRIIQGNLIIVYPSVLGCS